MDSMENAAHTGAGSKRSYIKISVIAATALLFSAALFAAGVYAAVEDVREDAAEANRALTEQGASAAADVDLADSLRISTVNKVIENESIPAYSVSEVMQLDVSKPSGVTLSDLKLVTKGGLVGLEEAFYKAEQDYGINCLFVMAIGANESAFGTVCFRKNNMFGFGRKSYATKAENIDVVARTLATKYLTPGASLYHGKTIDGVHKSYAASPVWDDHVAKHMSNFYSKISANHNAAIEKLK